MFPVLLLLVVCSQVGVSVQLHSWGPFFGQMSLLCLWGRLFRSQTGNKVFRGWKFWFRFRIRFRAELRIRFSLLKEFGNALCLCEVLTSLENQTVCVCVLTHCCYLYRTFLELQGEVFLVSWWLKVLFYQHTVDRREKKNLNLFSTFNWCRPCVVSFKVKYIHSLDDCVFSQDPPVSSHSVKTCIIMPIQMGCSYECEFGCVYLSVL